MNNTKAFPIPLGRSCPACGYDEGDQIQGMDLRDYFAIKALQGLMMRYREDGYSDEQAVTESYRIADAMMKVRETEASHERR